MNSKPSRKSGRDRDKKWRKVVLADLVAKILDNRGFTPPHNYKEGYPLIETWQIKNTHKHPIKIRQHRQKYVTEECYNNWFRAGHPREDDILMSTVGTYVPQFCLIPPEEKLCIAQNIVGIRGDQEKITQGFMRFLFLHDWFIDEVKRGIITTVQPSVKIPTFLEIEVKIPELREQKKLEEDLGAVVDKIELLRRQNVTLAQLAKHSFNMWCHSVPRRGKKTKLANVFSFVPGDRVPSNTYSAAPAEGLIRYTRVGDMDESRAPVYVRADSVRSRCDENDLLISFDGTIGKIEFGLQGSYATAIKKIISDDDNYDSLGFKYSLFSHPRVMDRIKAFGEGSVILHASAAIDHLDFPLHSPSKAAELNQMIDPFIEKILANKRQLVTLQQLLGLLIADTFYNR